MIATQALQTTRPIAAHGHSRPTPSEGPESEPTSNLPGAIGWLDRYIVDGVVNWVTWLTYQAAQRLRATQNGKAQDALYAVAIGFLLLACLAWLG